MFIMVLAVATLAVTWRAANVLGGPGYDTRRTVY